MLDDFFINICKKGATTTTVTTVYQYIFVMLDDFFINICKNRRHLTTVATVYQYILNIQRPRKN